MLALPHVVVEEEEHFGRELDDGGKVDEGHDAHGEVDNTPCFLKADEGTSHDGGSGDDAEDVDIGLL